MNITSAQFLKGLTGPDEILADGTDQVAFIGRSNVGKSSIINVLAQKKNLAITSSFPGRTQQINVFALSVSASIKKFYLIDLPGYGFAKASKQVQQELQQLIYWYFFESEYKQKKVVLIIDASIGFTQSDEQMLHSLADHQKNVIIVGNKIDKIKKSQAKSELEKLAALARPFVFVPFSAEKRIGITELLSAILAE